MLQLKNIKTGDTYDIPPEGSFMGRAGAKAEIQIADPGISKRHARIYQQGAGWFLEDVGSSNGTYIQGKRLTEPVQVQEGLVFGMSRNKFQVVAIGGNGAGVDDDMLFDQDLPPPDDVAPPGPPLPPPSPPPGMPPQADPYAAPQEIPPPQAYGQPPPPQPYPPPNGQTAPPQTAPPQYAAPPQQAQQPVAAADGGSADMTFGYFMAAIPKAIGYYFARVPLLIFNPFGTVRKSFEEQPMHPMGKAELMVYAFPAYAFSSLVGVLAGMVAGLVNGVFTFPIVSAIISVAVAAVISVIVGFVGHPFLGWLIRILKGESDARSRTNYFLIFFTITIVLAIPQGLATVLGSIPIPFIPAIAPLLTLVGTALSTLVFYKWMKFFGVHKVIPILILVFGGLGVLGAVAGFGGAVWSGVQQLMNGSPSVSVGDGDGGGDTGGSVDVDDLEIPDSVPKEARAGLQATLDGIKAMKAAGASAEAMQPSIDAFNQGLAALGAAPAVPDKPVAKPDKPVTKPIKPVVNPNAGKPKPDLSFGSFNSKRSGIERAIGKDPTVLDKSKVRNLYGALSTVVYEAEQEFTKQMDKKPELRLVHEKDRDARIWREAAGAVSDLATELGIK